MGLGQKKYRLFPLISVVLIILTILVKTCSSYSTNLNPSLFSSVERNVYKQNRSKSSSFVSQRNLPKRSEDRIFSTVKLTSSYQQNTFRDYQKGIFFKKGNSISKNIYGSEMEGHHSFPLKQNSKVTPIQYRALNNLKLFSTSTFAVEQEVTKTTRNIISNALRSISKRLFLVLPFFFSTFSGGFLAGSLHSVTGPDHLAALLPRCIGKSWGQALKVGAIWGLGHGASAFIMGFVAFMLKGRLEGFHFKGINIVDQLSLYTEGLIGLSLIAIGLIGIQEGLSYHTNREVFTSSDNDEAKDNLNKTTITTEQNKNNNGAIFLNGLLHGFSWDGTPTLAPALAFTSWKPVSLFLSAYGLGTVVSMAFATTLIGEGTKKMSEAMDAPDIPRRLSLVSSGIAIAVGIFWTVNSIKHYF